MSTSRLDRRQRLGGRLARAHGLWFLILGALFFVLRGWLPARDDARTIVIDDRRIAHLRTGFEAQWGTPPDDDQLRALVAQAIDDAVLEREARRLGLDRGDALIRQRLIGKTRAVADDPAATDEALLEQARALGLDRDVVVARLLRQKMTVLLERDTDSLPPDDDTLQAWLTSQAGRFAQPATVDLAQVVVGRTRHGEATARHARRLLARLRGEHVLPADAVALSDPFPLPLRWAGRSREALAQRFGETFAAAAIALPIGRWSEPVASPFGLHLLFVEAKRPARTPPLASIRQQVLHAWEEERAHAHRAAALARIRTRYTIDVSWPHPAIEGTS